MKQFFKTKKGITIIALVITIILLIILAGITVNAALDDNGLIDIIKRATKGYDDEVYSQEDKINDLYSELQISANGRVTMNSEELETYINRIVNEKIAENNRTYLPAGTVISYMAATPPNGYLKCEGQAVSRTDYADLFTAIGTTYGSGDGSTTFNLPDLRGEFLRGTGTNPTTGHSGANVGTHQQGSDVVGAYLGSTSGVIYVGARLYHTNMQNKTDNWVGNSGHTFNYGTVNRSEETSTYENTIGKGTSRPTNTSVLYCIKY